MGSTRMPGFRSVSLVLLVLLSAFVPALLAFLTGANQTNKACGSICESSNCDDTKNLRYGLFCGVGCAGTVGATPCDALDGCCREHDTCVGPNYVNVSNCNAVFNACARGITISIGNQTFANNTCNNITEVVQTLIRAETSGAGPGIMAGVFMGVPSWLFFVSLTAASFLPIF